MKYTIYSTFTWCIGKHTIYYYSPFFLNSLQTRNTLHDTLWLYSKLHITNENSCQTLPILVQSDYGGVDGGGIGGQVKFSFGDTSAITEPPDIDENAPWDRFTPSDLFGKHKYFRVICA